MNQLDPAMRSMARQVRDEHRRPATCTECYGVGPCQRYATWFPMIADLTKYPATWPGSDDAMRWWI